MGPHRCQGTLRLGAVHDGHEATLGGDVERVDAEDLARPPDLLAGGHGTLVDDDRHVGGARHLVEDGRHAPAGRVAQAPHTGGGVQERIDERGEVGGVGLDVGLDVELPSGEHDRDAVVADGARNEHRVARPGGAGPEGQRALDHAHAGGVDVAAVGEALLDHLGVAGDDLHTGRPGRRRHRGGDRLEVGDGKALLEDEGGGQVQGAGAPDGEVVDRAVHREVPDVAPREEERMDDERVGGERQPGAVDAQRRLVLHRLQRGVAEGLQEERVDERVGRLAPRSVGEGDPLLLDAGLAAALPVDPGEDLLLLGQGLRPELVLGELVVLGLGDRSLRPVGGPLPGLGFPGGTEVFGGERPGRVGCGRCLLVPCPRLGRHARVASLTRSRVNRPKL